MFLLAAMCVVAGIFPGMTLYPISLILESFGLELSDISITGPLPAPFGWHPGRMFLVAALSTALFSLYYRAAGKGIRQTKLHTCGVTDMDSKTVRVTASDLYESPVNLIKTVFTNRSEKDE